MKKIMLFALIALSMSVFAKNEKKIFVQSGDLSFLKEPEIAYIEIDFSKTIIVEYNKKMEITANHGTFEQYNAERGEDYVKDWPEVQKALKSYGLTKFNNKKGLTCSPYTKEECASLSEKELKRSKSWGWYLPIDRDIKYQINIVVDTIDLGNSGGMALNRDFKVGGGVVSGSMEIVNLENNTVICKLDFKECKGYCDFSERGRMGYAIQNIFEEMVKEVRKKK